MHVLIQHQAALGGGGGTGLGSLLLLCVSGES